jgi:hypothetical protein
MVRRGDMMNRRDYLVEAAEALEAPGEIWLFRDKILYDPASREWCFSGAQVKGLKFIGETRYWVFRICGWLQGKYPEGPVCSI